MIGENHAEMELHRKGKSELHDEGMIDPTAAHTGNAWRAC